MAIQPEQDLSEAAQDFGANDWLLEEMYDRYKADPSSVDSTWADFFQRHPGAITATSPSEPAAATTPTPVPSPRREQEPPAARPQAPAPEAKAPAEGNAPTPSVPASTQTPSAPVAEQQPPAPAPASAQTPPTKVAEQRPPQPAARATETQPPAPATPSAVSVETSDFSGAELYLPAEPPSFSKRPAPVTAAPETTTLRGAPMRTAKNMDTSLEIPTATSVRTVPMKMVIDHRTMINTHLARTIGGKVSFTHLIGYAMVRALTMVPAMNVSYEVVGEKPTLVEPQTVNLGIAIDLAKPDGTRQLLVPNIPSCEQLTFGQFWSAYEEVVSKARKGQLTVDDFAGTTASLTNPGGLGTNHSIPRLMHGQGLILGVGSIEYAPGFQGASPERLNEMGVSKVMTLTSTYDHRVIQGAQSGEFLRTMEQLLLGQHGFYDEIFTSLRIPYAPLTWDNDIYVGSAPELVDKEARVLELIASYRALGHLMADIDPLTYRLRSHPDLELRTHGLTLWDLDRTFPCGSLGGRARTAMTLRDALEILRDAYCRHIGVEYMHITDPQQRTWLQERLEQPVVPLSRDEHLRTLDKLNESEIFETFLQTKFIGQKRFSLEGGESAIVALDEICEQAADSGLDEVVIGMPHRGRLNVLANIVGKSYGQIFREFEGSMDPHGTQGTGDVKYHLGAEGEFTSAAGSRISVSVAANPSHLEAVDPVVEGIARAKADRASSEHANPVLPILLHGDAAFAGQGVVYETLQMSQLRGYRTGGTIHLVVNNQVGFTTAPVESRSSTYCTDVAKVVEAPVFHVNGDDPDACIRVARLAFDYRQQFGKDVVIDLVCYRRRGHNEGDDPSFTQPLMYDLIEAKRSTRKIYTDALIGRGDITTDDADEFAEKFRIRLETVFKEIRSMTAEASEEEYRKVPYYPAKLGRGVGTAISGDVMERIASAMTEFPEGFTVHPKVLPQLERRAEMIRRGPMDWATAEALAIGSLLLEGRPIRMSGQDTRRGTFSQRFAAVVDRRTNEAWVPLQHLSGEQGRFDIWDSLLSEYAAMGFEYGYSVAAPEALVCWEGQFGDFANGAQTIIDEFIAAGQAKWTQKSGVVLLLPHGYEGQGPDHSSARIERWLQLCSEGALAVCQPSTPASYFHLLRTHAYVNWHRPVVIITPKSMLRNKLAMSTPADITGGGWRPAMDDPTITDPAAVTRVVLCSGKIRWDLVAAREKYGLGGQVAIVPLERLYPLPAKELAEVLLRYRHVSDVRYAQDEPANQGAWWYMERNLPAAIKAELGADYELVMTPYTRPESSAPSVGSHHLHEEQQAALLKAALGAED